MSSFKLVMTLATLPLLAACSDEPRGTTLPTFDKPALVQGKNTWMQVCRNCHLTGVAGAPAVNDPAAWQQRLAKGKETLYRNAISGIANESGWTMPPRGGVDRLPDTDVQLAVDYMLAANAAIAARDGL